MFNLRAAVLIPVVCLLLVTPSHAAQKLKVDAKLAHIYETLAAEVELSNLADTIGTLSSQDSRMAGYPGCDAAGKYIREQEDRLGRCESRALLRDNSCGRGCCA